MSKEAFYFSHDYNARNDPRLMRLIMKEGMEGIGIYWCIIEMLYEQNGYIPLTNIESIAFELHLDCERIKNVLQKYDLFKFKDEIFYSESVMRRLKVRNKKSLGARESALKRWHPNKYNDANAMRTQCEGNAIKERKGKERKDNNISLFWDTYHSITGLSKTDYQAALKYWNKLSDQERQKAIDNIKPYFYSLNDKKYCKKARTYLADKNFNDEIKGQVKNNLPATDPRMIDDSWAWKPIKQDATN